MDAGWDDESPRPQQIVDLQRAAEAVSDLDTYRLCNRALWGVDEWQRPLLETDVALRAELKRKLAASSTQRAPRR